MTHKTKEYKYVKISLKGGGHYIQSVDEIQYAVSNELIDLPLGDKIVLTFEPVDITDEEYLNLPEFIGH